MHVHKEKLISICSGVALDDDIAKSILNMFGVGNSRMEDFAEKRLISKEISYHAPIKKNNYKSFPHVMRKIRITKKDASVKVAEVNRNILGALNSYKLKDRETSRFQKGIVVFSFSITFKHLQRRRKSSTYSEEHIKNILLQDLEDHINEGLQSL